MKDRRMNRICHIDIDESDLPAPTPEMEQERRVAVFDLLDAHGYNGWIGAEYEPRTQTIPGLGWGKEWGIGQPASGPEKPRK